MVDLQALASQHDVNSEVPITDSRGGDFADTSAQNGLIVTDGLVTMPRAVDRSTLHPRVADPGRSSPDSAPAHADEQALEFFATTSCNMTLSKLKSATSCLSR